MVDLERKGVSEITTMDILNQPQKRMAKMYSLLELLGEFEEKGWIYKHRDPFRNYRLTIVGESVLNGKSSTTLYLDGPNDRFTNSTWILIFVLGVNAFMLLPWELSILTIICALLIRWVGVGRYRYLKRRPFSPTPLNP